uniref:Vacuolar ATPase assembly integral membrane protein VMA21 homolog n=1 Tax=Hemiselmis andersenii TaxID=464988 RepID=A0A6U2G1A1_HEMAN|mmetsp:Transcript_34816/g.81633  ORF Transcript_34816/g.81633 Transcript_34816/m.81633 type:complete len:107 (+) Transcript_34816:182-502(+)
MATMNKMGKLREIVADPGNRPAVSLLLQSSVAMAVVPLAVYFACFYFVFGEGGLIDYSKDVNSRTNYSGIAAIVTVQFVIAAHVVLAFRQDDAEFAKEAAEKKKDK